MINDADPYWHNAGKTIRECVAEATAQLAAKGQKDVAFIELGVQQASDGYGADWHPNLKTHRLMAERLEVVLAKDLGWNR